MDFKKEYNNLKVRGINNSRDTARKPLFKTRKADQKDCFDHAFGEIMVEDVCFFDLEDDSQDHVDDTPGLCVAERTSQHSTCTTRTGRPCGRPRKALSSADEPRKRRNANQPRKAKVVRKTRLEDEDYDMIKRRMVILLREPVDMSTKPQFAHLIWMTFEIRERIKFMTVFDSKDMNDLFKKVVTREDSLCSLFSLTKNLSRVIFGRDEFEGKRNLCNVTSSPEYRLWIKINCAIFGFKEPESFKSNDLFQKLSKFLKNVVTSKNRQLWSNKEVLLREQHICSSVHKITSKATSPDAATLAETSLSLEEEVKPSLSVVVKKSPESLTKPVKQLVLIIDPPIEPNTIKEGPVDQKTMFNQCKISYSRLIGTSLSQ